MWQQIAAQISLELDIDFQVERKISLTGGSINLAYKISGCGHDFFVKLHHREQLEQFENEQLSLVCLAQTHCVRVPKVICVGQTLDKAFLVLEYLPLEPAKADHPASWHRLAEHIAKLHQQHEQAMFGFDWDNQLGLTTQPNQWQGNWSSFFSEQRLGWQLQLLLEQGFGFGNIDHIVEQARQRLVHHKPKPSLLHGDLWRGNVGFTAESPVIFDPASYFGDREADIACSSLYGTFPAEFYHHYQQYYPLAADFEERKALYNLYHILNHANLFRGNYLIQAQEQIKRLFHLKGQA
ncbi:fructosamine kinase family protein [Alishewanella sp. HL-SH05]|uniref:fructosamine kinase family protein n=1 Tax=Alishewanella sp. HL-SH05 TaxID=3461145 RepID=UPI0040420718